MTEIDDLELSEIKRRVLKSGTLQFVRAAIIQVVSLLSNIIVARQLMPNQVGIFAVVASYMGLISLFSNCGVWQTLVRQETRPTPEEENSVLIVSAMLTGALSALLLAAAVALKPELFGLIAVFAAAMVVDTFQGIPLSRLSRQIAFDQVARVELWKFIAYHFTLVMLVLLGKGVWSFVFATLAKSTVAVLVATIICRWEFRLSFDFSGVLQRMKVGAQNESGHYLQALQLLIYPPIVGALFGSATIGQVAFAQETAEYVTRGTGFFERMLGASFARAKSNADDFAKMIETTINGTTLLVCGIASILLPMAEPLIQHLFGSKWMPALPFLYLFILSHVLQSIPITLPNVVFALGRTDLTLRYGLLTTAISFAFAMPGFALVGPIAYPLALVCAQVAGFYLVYAVRQLTKFRVLNPLLPGLLAGLLNVILTMSVVHWQPPRNVVWTLFYCAMSGLTYCVVANALMKNRPLTATIRFVRSKLAR